MTPLGRRTVIGAAAAAPLAAAAAPAAAAAGPAEPGREPPAGLRLNDFWVHDPFVVADRRTRTYHLYLTNVPETSGVQGAGTMMYRSRDLVSWQGPYVVFTAPDDNWATDGGWAPEVHRHRTPDGRERWYLFTTLHDEAQQLAAPPDVLIRTYRRGTVIAAADSPYGPFRPLDRERPHTPDRFMALDGTLLVEDGQPWLVYAHEWIQRLDGTMEAIRLAPDLSRTVGEPIHLFKASDAPWINELAAVSDGPLTPYVTDGCEFHRSRTGELLMLWSTWAGPADDQVYVQTQARSASGRLAGPWVQGPKLTDGGHGMPFRAFDGTLLLVLHRPFGQPTTRAKLYELIDAGDRFELGRRRTDLDGGD